MTAEEHKKAYEEYLEWEKTSKFFVCGHEDIKMLPDGTCQVYIRNGDRQINVGDWLGGTEVLKIYAYGKELQSIGQGTTGVLILSRLPTLTVEETHPDFVKWLKDVRNAKSNRE